MKAIRVHEFGGPEVMRLEEVPAPGAGPAQVLLKVRAASVNPIDWKMRRGLLASIFPLTFPRTLGRDCAGEVDGKLIEVFGDLHPGDEVASRGTDELRPGTRVSAKPTAADSQGSPK